MENNLVENKGGDFLLLIIITGLLIKASFSNILSCYYQDSDAFLTVLMTSAQWLDSYHT